MRCWLLSAAVLVTSTACQQEPPPSPGSGAPESSNPAPSSPPSAAPPASSAPVPAAPASASGKPAAVGGSWLKCYANFRPRTQPKLDVMRLGLMCGPANGMRKLTDVAESEVKEGGAGREHRWEAKAGDCFRLFAVADAQIQDLDVEVRDFRNRVLASDTSDDRWPVVKPDGPLCVFEPGAYRAVVRAQRGSGRYAIEIWRLP